MSLITLINNPAQQSCGYEDNNNEESEARRGDVCKTCNKREDGEEKRKVDMGAEIVEHLVVNAAEVRAAAATGHSLHTPVHSN